MSTAPERPSLLLVDDRPTTFTTHVLGRDDLDVVLLRFAEARDDLPAEHLAATAHRPAFWLRGGADQRREADRYLAWSATLPNPPRHFCNPSEPRQLVAHRFAGLVGLPHLGSQQVCWFRDKLAMKKRLRVLGLDTAAFGPVRAPGDIERFAAAHGWPVVLKPVDSFACIDTFRIDGPAAAAAWRPPDRAMMVESYLGGVEAENCALVLDGEVLDIWPSALPARPLEIVDGSINANISASDGSVEVPGLRAATQRIVSGMGLDHGYLHMEYFHDGGRLVIGEVGARVAGCEITANHGYAYDFDVFAATLDVHLGRRPALRYGRLRCVGDLLLPLPRSGVLREITPVEDLLALPGVVHAVLKFRPGQDVTARRASHSSSGHVHVAGADVAEVTLRMRHVLEHFHIDVEAEGGLSAWSA